MKSPADAMELYEGARRNGSRFAGLAIADAWQFDMKDPKRAIAEYRKILASLPAMPVAGDEASNFAPWARRWVESQIRFLEKGATFSGRLTQDDSRMTAVMTMGILGIPEETFEIGSAVRKASAASRADATRTPEPDKAEVARLLEALPSSTIALLASAPHTYLLPDADSILAFLRRQDPAGFATACFFMMIELYEVAEDKKPPAAMQEAKTRFLRERRIDIGWIADAINRAESERARNK
jgi:hypothetical protein